MDTQHNRKDRFKRLATKRTNAVLKSLTVLGHCANTSAYDYSEEEVSKIFTEIEKTVRYTKAKFQFVKNPEFKL